MSWLRRIMLSLGILALVTFALAGHYYYKGFYKPVHRHAVAPSSLTDLGERKRIDQKAAVQKAYLQRHGFNSDFCFLVDMQLPSGKDRFFVYDLHKDSVVLAGLVTHCCGRANFINNPSFFPTNVNGCTSPGKNQIGSPPPRPFWRAYKLYGLDAPNDQAFNRNIVLHSFASLPEGETYPYPICNSRGCPMVSPAFLKQLQPLIDKSGKPVLLCIFD